jgi:hypothetical protein
VVGIEPPPEPPIELLRTVDIRDRDDDDFELHVDSPAFGSLVASLIRTGLVLMTAS